MILQMDYQIIIDMCGQMLVYALPIGIICGLVERIANMFISAVTGEKKVKL